MSAPGFGVYGFGRPWPGLGFRGWGVAVAVAVTVADRIHAECFRRAAACVGLLGLFARFPAGNDAGTVQRAR